MAIINPKPTMESAKIKISIDAQVLAEIEQYCKYAKFKKHDDFFEEAASHILSKDKDFKEWKENNT
jgi:metal-responsive CopG/Arc/MetJ family transcriptional regulator